MKRKILPALNILFIFIFFAAIPYFAQDMSAKLVLEPSCQNIKRGEPFCVKIKAHLMKDIQLSSINMKIKFDNKKFEFTGAKTNPDEEQNFKFSTLDGEVDIFLMNSTTPTQQKKDDDKDICILNFETKENAKFGASKITSQIVSFYDYNHNSVSIKNASANSINIVPLDVSECELLDLTPSFGALTPNFKPDIYDYTLNVPNEIKDVYFDFSAASPNAKVSITRHKLNAAGQPTHIRINVYNKKENFKLTYNVKVNRAQEAKKIDKSNKSDNLKIEIPHQSNSKSLSSSSAIYKNYNSNLSEKISNFESEIVQKENKLESNGDLQEDDDKYNEKEDVNLCEGTQENKNINSCKNYQKIEKDEADEENEEAENPTCKKDSDCDENIAVYAKHYGEPNKNRYILTLLSSLVLTIFSCAYSLIKVLKQEVKEIVKQAVKYKILN